MAYIDLGRDPVRSVWLFVLDSGVPFEDANAMLIRAQNEYKSGLGYDRSLDEYVSERLAGMIDDYDL